MDSSSRVVLSISRSPLPQFLTAALLIFLSVGAAQAQERGWGDTWTKPRSERQLESEKAFGQIAHDLQAKDYAGAERQIDALVKQSPENVGMRVWRARVHAAMKHYPAALQDCAEAITLLQKQEPRALGNIYTVRAAIYNAMGQPAAARAELERAVRTDKGNAQFNNNLAWFLGTSPDATQRNGSLAIRYARTALQLGGAHDPGLVDTLAAAEAEAGDFGQAAQHEREALALAKGNKLRRGDKRLRLYENHQPYREPATNEIPTSD